MMQVKYADLEMPRDLPRGKHQALPEHLVDRLYELAGLVKPVPETRRVRAPRVAADRQRKPAKRSVRAAEPRNSRERKGPRDTGSSPGRRKPAGGRRSGR
ncbi:hypothetical protein [Povalibacter sp.]|uniref:hypothetical protein n=1 Tax=Povalibacter sp. TaxID=1962978 RepID=UPI002D1FB33E|nr:hypothetical protein [Povalibacter sp.]